MVDFSAETINNKWIVSLRGEKNKVDPFTPYAFHIEKEYTINKKAEDVATVFLSNKECPFRCLMCDLWKNTTDEQVPEGAIPAQIKYALSQLPPTKHLKLYNSGNFFDKKAIPVKDYDEIAALTDPFETITVECHPKLINQSCVDFNEMIKPDLQVAIGLETIHPGSISILNKQMSLEEFSESVNYLNQNGISVRTFILVGLPLLSAEESVYWAKKSIEFAFEAGVECCAVIPTRSGNGAMDWLKDNQYFVEPTIEMLGEVLEFGLQLRTGRVFADLWDLKHFSRCSECFNDKFNRLNEMNLKQELLPAVNCLSC